MKFMKELKLKIPEDFSIIDFDDIPEAENVDSPDHYKSFS